MSSTLTVYTSPNSTSQTLLLPSSTGSKPAQTSAADKIIAISNSANEEHQLKESASEIHSLVMSMPLDTLGKVMHDLLEKSDDDLVKVFTVMREDTLKELSNAFIWLYPNDFTAKLSACLIKIVEGKESSENKRKLISGLCTQLKDSNLKTTATTFYINSNLKIISTFLEILQDERLVTTFVSTLDKVKFQEDSKFKKTLFMELAKNIPETTPKQSRVFYHLSRFSVETLIDPKSWQHDIFLSMLKLNNHKYIDNHTISCFLWHTSPEVRQVIAKNYNTNTTRLASWLNGVLKLEAQIENKVAFVREMTKHLNIKLMTQLLNNLITFQPNIIPYLLITCSDDFFSNFCGDSSYLPLGNTFNIFEDGVECVFTAEARTKTINAYTPNLPEEINLIAEKLECNDRHTKLLYDTTFCSIESYSHFVNNEYIVDKKSNITSLWELLNQIDEQLKDVNPELQQQVITTTFLDQLQSMPPLLLAIGMYDSGVNHLISTYLQFWSEEQLKVIAGAMKIDDCLNALEENDKIDETKFKVIINSVTYDTFQEYCKIKTDTIRIKLKNVNKLIEEIESKFQDSLKESQLSRAMFNSWFTKSLQPKTILKAFTTKNQHAIQNRAIELMNDAKTNHPVFINCVEEYLNVEKKMVELEKLDFKGKIQQLENLVPKDKNGDDLEKDDADFTSNISPVFFEFISIDVFEKMGFKEDNPYLRLPNAGILSDKDLAHLHFKEKREIELRTMKNKILDFIRPGPNSEEPENAWNKLFFESTDFAKDSDEFASNKTFLHSPDSQLKRLALSLIGIIENSTCLKPEGIELVTELKTKLEKQSEESQAENTIAIIFYRILIFALEYYQAKSIIILLTNYLKQDNLEETWNKLRAEGMTSLHALFENGKLKKKRDVFKLAEKLKQNEFFTV